MNNAAFLAFMAEREGPLPAWLGQLIDTLTASAGLVKLIDRQGLIVLGDPAAAHLILPGESGLIWGHLFDRAHFTRLTAPGELAHCPADQLLDRYWGGYVSIRTGGDGVEVLRDPSGTVACYQLAHRGVQMVTSRPDLLFASGLIAPCIDWTILAQSLVYRDLRPAQTALHGVSELLPGVCLEVRDGAANARCAWSPWRFAEAGAQIGDGAGAVAALRKTATAVLRAWAGCFERPLIEISGGIDSAIVAAGISGATDARCLTFGPAPGDADELPWARAVAGHLGLPLTEMLAHPATVDIGRSDAWRQPRPCARALSQAFDRPIQAMAQAVGADAFLGGAGGDSMFCLLHSALPVVDRLRAEGFGKGVFETAADIARIARTHIGSVLLAASRRALRGSAAMPKPMTNPFLASHVAHALPWPANPWLKAPVTVTPGKKRHVWSIIAIQNHLEGYGREAMAPFIAPLMSQPIFETCVAIPTWLWCRDGNNRAIAREAFRHALPAAVIDRRSKVSFNGLVQRVIAANLPHLLEMLLEGALARERLVDRNRIEIYLAHDLSRGELLPELMALVDVEAWVHHWERGSGASIPAGV